MKRFNTLEQLQNAYLQRGMIGAFVRAFCGKDETADPTPSNQDDGNVWQLQSTDNDASIAQVFGAPLMELTFERVRFHPEEEHFLCDLVRDETHRDILVIPDDYWLDDGRRAWLLSQI